MNFEQFYAAISEKAASYGFQEFELYQKSQDTIGVSINKQEIEQFEASETTSLCFRGTVCGRMGYSSTDVLDDDAVDYLLTSAGDAAENSDNDDNDDCETLHPSGDKYEEQSFFSDSIEKTSVQEIIDIASELERKLISHHNNISRVSSSCCSKTTVSKRIRNTLGIDLYERKNFGRISGECIYEKDGTKNSGGLFRYTDDYSSVDMDYEVNEACREAADYASAGTVATGKYDIVFSSDAIAAIVGAFMPVFSAERVQQGMSMLKGKEGEAIAASIITITDDPFYKGGIRRAVFDDEGVATYKKNIIDNGIMRTLLYNNKMADKAGTLSTGNGYKPSVASSVGTAAFNICLNAGTSDEAELLSIANGGIYIEEVSGLHAGVNTISGDFSVMSKGYMITGGKPTKAVRQFTLSGNYYDLLKNISMLGNRLYMRTSIAAPKVYVPQMRIAGK